MLEDVYLARSAGPMNNKSHGAFLSANTVTEAVPEVKGHNHKFNIHLTEQTKQTRTHIHQPNLFFNPVLFSTLPCESFMDHNLYEVYLMLFI